MSKNKSKLGERLSKVMIINKIGSQAEFCEKVGLDKTTTSRLMSGDKSLNMNHLTKILNIFPDISANWLVLGEGSIELGHSDSKELEANAEINELTIAAMRETIDSLKLNKELLQKEVVRLEAEIKSLKRSQVN